MAEEVKSTAKATAKQVRIAPRKARLVVDLIRGKDVGEATAILRHTQRAASPVVEKVLNSAIANAEHNYEMNPYKLYVSSVYVEEGITMKNYRQRAQKSAGKINKRTHHIPVVVSEKKEASSVGQKINPTGLCAGIIKDWEIKCNADKDYSTLPHEDIKIR